MDIVNVILLAALGIFEIIGASVCQNRILSTCLTVLATLTFVTVGGEMVLIFIRYGMAVTQVV